MLKVFALCLEIQKDGHESWNPNQGNSPTGNVQLEIYFNPEQSSNFLLTINYVKEKWHLHSDLISSFSPIIPDSMGQKFGLTSGFFKSPEFQLYRLFGSLTEALEYLMLIIGHLQTQNGNVGYIEFDTNIGRLKLNGVFNSFKIQNYQDLVTTISTAPNVISGNDHLCEGLESHIDTIKINHFATSDYSRALTLNFVDTTQLQNLSQLKLFKKSDQWNLIERYSDDVHCWKNAQQQQLINHQFSSLKDGYDKFLFIITRYHNTYRYSEEHQIKCKIINPDCELTVSFYDTEVPPYSLDLIGIVDKIIKAGSLYP